MSGHVPLCDFGTLVRLSDPEENEEFDTRDSKKKMKRNGTQSTLDSRSRHSTVNKDDQREENGVWFWVNKNGFPVDDMTWDRMWDHVAKIHPDGYKMVTSVRANNSLPQVRLQLSLLILNNRSILPTLEIPIFRAPDNLHRSCLSTPAFVHQYLNCLTHLCILFLRRLHWYGNSFLGWHRAFFPKSFCQIK